ncbi:MAG: TonB C-terminal domain-containing protein [Deltaproteobacteria bacterium]|nr:TonB C-terminal domain-containing protein [Deltaproteobacteria bacterium]
MVERSPLQKYLLFSLLAHGLFVILLTTSPFFQSFQRPLFQEKVTWINLPLGATDKLEPGFVKAKDLPKSTIQEQKQVLSSPAPTAPDWGMKTTPEKKVAKPVPSAPPTGPVPPAPTAAALKNKANDDLIKKALARINADVRKNKVIQPEVGQIPTTKEGGVPFGSPEATSLSPTDPEYLLYQAKVRDKIMSQWIVPITLQGMDLTSQIFVRINEKGDVIETEWLKKSGSEALDLSVLRAIERASPLEIPPEKMKSEAVGDGFLIEFNTRQKGMS